MSEKEALELLDKKLPIPAYDFVIKASHAFNMLEARGVISVSERTNYMNRIRSIACRVAKQFAGHREDVGFPLLKTGAEKKTTHEFNDQIFDPNATDDFILEIGVEELPQTFVPIGIKNLKKDLEAFLSKEKLSYSKIETYGSPRRLVAYITGLALGKAAEKIEKRGPPVAKAFDNNGNATPLGKGLLKSLEINSCTLKDIYEQKEPLLRIEEVKGSLYLFVTHAKKQKSTRSIFHQTLSSLILGLDFPKKMYWSDLKIAFARPIHWIVAMHGKENIPLEIANVKSADFSYGHPILSPNKIVLKNAQDYFKSLEKEHVTVNQVDRENQISSQLEKIETKLKAKATHTQQVMSEVLYLCEAPCLIVGTFDSKFLELPRELIELVLINHQRYFPLQDLKGNLLPSFVVCLDTRENETIKKGHEKAVSPRLSDGLFLFHQDLQCGLEHFSDKLKDITFQKEHGSLENKSKRLLKHAEAIQLELKLDLNLKELPEAAKLLKADLASHIVFEFPELQGVAGRVYAQHEKKPLDVTAAIYEHWLPRFEDDKLPTNPMGILFSLADKLDNILACFLAGHIPSSSSDPFALRRQALGIIRICIENNLNLPITGLLKQSLSTFKVEDTSNVVNQITQFIESRIKTVLTQYKLNPDEIQAVLKSDQSELDIYELFLKAQSLHEFKKHELFVPLLEVYKRAKGQINTKILTPIDTSQFETDEEKNLYNYFNEIKPQFFDCLENRHYLESFHLLATLHPFLSKLFDKVKILVDNESLRMTRLALLSEILSLFNSLFDFSLVTKQ